MKLIVLCFEKRILSLSFIKATVFIQFEKMITHTIYILAKYTYYHIHMSFE